MKFTLSWLKDHLKSDESLEQIVDKLTAIGLEVENVDNRSALQPFIIARILTSVKHPDADQLQVLRVETGEKTPVQVICSAVNARAGLIGVFAPFNTYIPGYKKILSIATIRGIKSFGMMCSEHELLLSNEHHKIIDLPADAPVGTSFAIYAGLDDPIIDISLTPNRADCAGVHGIARDLFAAGIGTLKKSRVPAILRNSEKNSVKVRLVSHGKQSPCLGFSWRMVKDTRNGASPQWMQQRLIAIEQCPVNALVDITNYLTFDRCRPLHIFDADKIEGDLAIRQAYDGEKLLALNGKEYTLSSKNCVIADRNGIVAIAGIIGGKNTSCDATTRNIIVESALWNPLSIAQTGREFNIVSNARYRFERGVDPGFMIHGLECATRMICDICGGKPTNAEVICFEEPVERKVLFSFTEVKRLTGLEIPKDKTRSILACLGFKVEDTTEDKIVTVKVPTWRPDISEKADLVEEIVRIYGINRIKPQPFTIDHTILRKPPAFLQSRNARMILAGRGMMEAITWSFISEKMARMFGGGHPDLKLKNPISDDMSDMRPSLLPGLIVAAQRNIAHGLTDLALFEISDVYKGHAPEEQHLVAGGIRHGTAKMTGSGRFWANNAGSVDVFDAKADALAVLASFRISTNGLQIERGTPSWYHPGRSGIIKLSPEVILGYFGEFHPTIREDLDIQGPLCCFEIFINAIPEARKKVKKIRPPLLLSPLQKVTRDFAFVVDRTVPAASIVQATLNADKKLIQSVQIFDHFEGAHLGAGKKSVAIEITIQPFEHTLKDEDFEVLSRKVINNVVKKTNGVLRKDLNINNNNSTRCR
ncbi:MAG: phenylalanyl-tRNA synthetase beta chain [Candidatus Tokpelaia sp. JSC085]|nr:MAG: phenylalanyl-tRNA synthetase beta chain [Candidatus Tokpelaia sp. JSC085]